MSIRNYIEHMKGKSAGERKRFAFGASLGVAGLVFLGWATMLVSSGTLAFNAPEKNEPVVAASNAGAGLAGAAAAFSSVFRGEDTLTAVDTRASTTLDQQDTGEATVIPF